MRIFWVLLGPLLVAASEQNGQGLRNYYTGKVSVGFENFDDDQPQLIPYAGEGVEGAPETDDSKILEYGTHVVHPRKHQRNSRELKRTSEEKRTRPRNLKPTRPAPLTTMTTTTEAPPFPDEEFATGGRAPPAPNEIPPELRAAFGSFGIGGGGERPIFETKEASVEATTEEPITTTSIEMRIKKQRRKHRKYQMSNTVKPVVISVTTAPREIPPELRQVFGIEKPDVEKSVENSRELFDDHFEQKKRIVVEKEYMKSASAEDKKQNDESEIADQIEEELVQKKRRRKYKKSRSTTTTAPTMEASVSGEEDERWGEVSNEEVEMRRQAEEEIVQQAERKKADARRLKAMEDERVRLIKQKAELEKEQADREKAEEKRLKAMEEARILLETERKAERERQQAEKAKERERIRVANEEKAERERLEAEREKEEAKRLKEIEDERERQVNEKKAELERLQEAIRQKKEELKAQERLEKNLSMKGNEKSEQENNQQNDSAGVKRKALLEKRKGPGRGAQKKMRSKGEQRQQLPPIPDSMRVPETPMNHVEVEPPQFQRPQPLPKVEEEESFAEKILSRAPNFATKITPHKDSQEKTKIHGLNTYNPMMEPEKEETEKQTGFATLKVFPVNEEEIIDPNVDPNEATFKGSWETTTQSTTRVTKAKKSNKPRKEKKWSQEAAREYYEQYYREWAANQTRNVKDSSEETTTLQSILLRGLKQRPRMMPNGEESAPSTPVPRDFDTGVKPVPLMTAMYGAIPSGPQALQGPLPAHQSTMPISRPVASSQPVASNQPIASNQLVAPKPSQPMSLKNLQLPSSFGGLGATNPFQAMMGLGGMGGMGALSGLVPPGIPATKGNMFGIADPRGGGRGDLTYEQLNQLCLSVKGVSRAFGIDDMKGFAQTNCGLIASFYNDASCDQIQHVMEYCEAYFKDPEHKG